MSDKPNLIRSMQIPPLMNQNYERYLPTAFDESMSLLEKVNKVIHYLHEYTIVTNDMLMKWNEVYGWVMNEGLDHAVSYKLIEWLDNGTLENIINERLFGDLKEKVDSVYKEIDGVMDNIETLKDGLKEKVDSVYKEIGGVMDNIETLKDGLNDRGVNVKSLGAKGDGVTDDIVAISRAIETGQNIFFPQGTYLVSKSIEIPSNRVVYGSGIDKTIIKFHDNAPKGEDLIRNKDITYGNTNIYISDLTLDGNTSRLGSGFGGSGGSRDSNLVVRASKHVHIRRIKSINSSLHGFDVTCGGLDYPYTGDGTVAPRPSQFISISDCEASHFGDDGITTHHSEFITISNCYLHTPRLRGNQNGIEVDDGTRHITLSNNTSEGCFGGVEVKAHGTTSAPYNVTINGHTSIEDCRSYNFRHIGHHSADDPDSKTARNILCTSLVSINPNNRKNFQDGSDPRIIVISAYNGVVINGLTAYTDEPSLLTDVCIATQFKSRNITLTNIIITGFSLVENAINVIGGARRSDNVNISNITLLNSGNTAIYIGGSISNVNISNVVAINEGSQKNVIVQTSNSNPQISGISGDGYRNLCIISGVAYDHGITLFNGAFRGASASSGKIHEGGFLLGTTGSSEASASKSGVVSSSTSTADGERSLVATSTQSRASGGRSVILSSHGVRQVSGYKVNGGYGDLRNNQPQTSNIKWELDSLNGHIKASGNITGSSNWNDYAEYFESHDGEKIESGSLVTLENGFIRKANEGDKIIGAISETAGVVLGENTWYWKDKYLRNEFGGYIYEDKIIVDDDGNGELVKVPKDNPDYDVNESYVPRSERKEWHIVGLLGQLYVRIDESVSLNEGINAIDGVATKGDTGIVMEITRSYDPEMGYGIAKVLLV